MIFHHCQLVWKSVGNDLKIGCYICGIIFMPADRYASTVFCCNNNGDNCCRACRRLCTCISYGTEKICFEINAYVC